MSDTPRTDEARLDEHDPYAAVAGLCVTIERELAAANERIRRLELAGDAMECALGEWDPRIDRDKRMAWIEAKEAKP